MSQAIVSLLARNDVAVNRGILALHNANTVGERELPYFAQWVSSGRSLSGSFLARARELTIRHAAELAAIAGSKEAAPIAAFVPSSLTLDRKGSFVVQTFGNSHCGTEAIQTVEYEFHAECEATLDPRGFLADQLLVDNYFQGIRYTPLSCERLCMASLQGVRAALIKNNPSLAIKAMSLTLSPAPFKARLTCKLGV